MRLLTPIALCAAFLGCDDGPRGGSRGERIAPVEVAPVTTGPIALRRTFSGSLEPRASIALAPKLTGRVVSLPLDIGDPVKRGQVVAQLEAGDLRQAVSSAEAEHQLQRASYKAAVAEADQAKRNLDRVGKLFEKKITAESQYDEAKALSLAANARVAEASARVARAKSELAGAKIRLGYTQVVADWPDGDGERVIAERYIDPGDLVAVNGPIYRVVEVDPVTAAFFITEVDYARLAIGQAVSLQTDAYPSTTFVGEIERLSPIFDEQSRQARVEVKVSNEDGRLRPGMFVRATVELASVATATLIPSTAVVRRDGRRGVFRVTDAGDRVEWKDVELGLEENGRVQVQGELTGKVVTLGHQLVESGSKIRVPSSASDAAAAAR